jgi:hypothetical protein
MSRRSSSTSARTTTPPAPTPNGKCASTSASYRPSATPSPSTRRPHTPCAPDVPQDAQSVR